MNKINHKNLVMINNITNNLNNYKKNKTKTMKIRINLKIK